MNNKVMDQKMLINMIKRVIQAAEKLSDGPHKDAITRGGGNSITPPPFFKAHLITLIRLLCLFLNRKR